MGGRRPESHWRWRRASRAAAAFLAVAVAATSAACGASTPVVGDQAATTRSIEPPSLELQGCSYLVDGTVPPGESPGLQPSFKPFSPSLAADSAVARIAAHGGTALVYGFDLPAGTSLYAGPDTASGAVGTVPPSQSILAADPVLWTTAAGAHWLAFFLICGGDSLYWVSVDTLAGENHQAGTAARDAIAELQAAAPYTESHRASALPIRIDPRHRIVWADASLPFAVGRGQLTGS